MFPIGVSAIKWSIEAVLIGVISRAAWSISSASTKLADRVVTEPRQPQPKPTASRYIKRKYSVVPESKKPGPAMASAVRQASRDKLLTTTTAGLAPSYLQANLIVLPAKYATDFRLLCQRNPVPCPLIAESVAPGNYSKLRSYLPNISDDEIIIDVDLRHDFPRYFIYQDGVFQKDCLDIQQSWSKESVAFLVGCSYSFEAALAGADLPAAHVANGSIVPMYRTTLPLCPSGIFDDSTYVVSMRPYLRSDLEKVRSITRPFSTTHGEPIAWGWEGAKKLGIKDVQTPDWGDKPAVDLADGYVPVFWGCGVTTQEAVMQARLPELVMSHAPGHMLLLDVKDDQVFDLPS